MYSCLGSHMVPSDQLQCALHVSLGPAVAVGQATREHAAPYCIWTCRPSTTWSSVLASLQSTSRQHGATSWKASSMSRDAMLGRGCGIIFHCLW